MQTFLKSILTVQASLVTGWVQWELSSMTSKTRAAKRQFKGTPVSCYAHVMFGMSGYKQNLAADVPDGHTICIDNSDKALQSRTACDIQTW